MNDVFNLSQCLANSSSFLCQYLIHWLGRLTTQRQTLFSPANGLVVGFFREADGEFKFLYFYRHKWIWVGYVVPYWMEGDDITRMSFLCSCYPHRKWPEVGWMTQRRRRVRPTELWIRCGWLGPWRKCKWWPSGGSRFSTAASRRRRLALCVSTCQTLRSSWTCDVARECWPLDVAPPSPPVSFSWPTKTSMTTGNSSSNCFCFVQIAKRIDWIRPGGKNNKQQTRACDPISSKC